MSTTSSVTHVSDDMRLTSGGVPAVVRQISRQLISYDWDVSIIHARGDAGDLASAVKVTKCFPSTLGRIWGYSTKLSRELKSGVSRLSSAGGCLHIHGVWTAAPTLASLYARSAGVPSICTVHGMLTPWLWNSQGWRTQTKKKVFWEMLGKNALTSCTVVHATTELERRELLELLPRRRIEVIPNAIELSPIPIRRAQPNKNILFLGRLERKKGVDVLIRAFALAELGPEWCLEIAGPSWSDSYFKELKEITLEYGISHKVRFLGPVFGQEKSALLEQAWVLAAPSHSDTPGLVNLEAADKCLPSITSKETGLWNWEQGGGVLAAPTVNDVTSALRFAASWSLRERERRGELSRMLVERHYSWRSTLPLWLDLYRDLQVDSRR